MAQLLADDVLLVSNVEGQILTLWDLSTIQQTFGYDGPLVCRDPKWESKPLAKPAYVRHPPWPPSRITDDVAFQVIPQLRGMCLLKVPLPLGRDVPNVSPCSGPYMKHVHDTGAFSFSRGEIAYIELVATFRSMPPSIFVCDEFTLDEPLAFTIPFRDVRPFFDVHSARLMLDDCPTENHICTLVGTE